MALGTFNFGPSLAYSRSWEFDSTYA